MKFPYLLFDADDTLFDFPKAAARAFSAMCRSNGVPDTLDTRALYHRINQELRRITPPETFFGSFKAAIT